jgi:preprotein translocase subunit SecF
MFTGKFKITLSISIIIIVVGVICAVAFGGLNLGIDFTGGSLTTIDFKADYDTDVVRGVLADNDAADSPIVKTGTDFTEAEIRMRDVGDDELQATVTDNIMAGIHETYPDAELISVDRVGGVASSDLVKNALLAVVVACLLMLVYIWIRFELYSGVAAVIALAHDVLIMISVVAIVRLQINSGFIAACLTIVGYSINNTIVVFDRIRDNRKTLKPKHLSNIQLADMSIKETLSRTINTSVTTLIMIVCLYIFGVDSIKEFSLPIIVGLIAGTYSSIFLSAPIWARFMDRAEKNKKANTAKVKRAVNLIKKRPSKQRADVKIAGKNKRACLHR